MCDSTMLEKQLAICMGSVFSSRERRYKQRSALVSTTKRFFLYRSVIYRWLAKPPLTTVFHDFLSPRTGCGVPLCTLFEMAGSPADVGGW